MMADYAAPYLTTSDELSIDNLTIDKLSHDPKPHLNWSNVLLSS